MLISILTLHDYVLVCCILFYLYQSLIDGRFWICHVRLKAGEEETVCRESGPGQKLDLFMVHLGH